MRLTWNEKRNGLSQNEMDVDNREFLALLEILNDAGDAEFLFLFQKLVDHLRLHFVREGSLMRLGKFPALGDTRGSITGC